MIKQSTYSSIVAAHVAAKTLKECVLARPAIARPLTGRPPCGAQGRPTGADRRASGARTDARYRAPRAATRHEHAPCRRDGPVLLTAGIVVVFAMSAPPAAAFHGALCARSSARVPQA